MGDANLDELIAAWERLARRPYHHVGHEAMDLHPAILAALKRGREAERERDAAITAAVAAEREECRKIADEQVALIETLQASYEGMPPIQGLARECARTARSIRDAIEARGEDPTNG